MKTTVLIADDHRMIRQGLCALLEQEDSLEVIGEASNGVEAVDLAVDLTPDVVIMDINMPEMDGIQATALLRQKVPQIKVVALTMNADPRFLQGMLDAGALGYVLKEAAFERLAAAVHAVNRGEQYFGA